MNAVSSALDSGLVEFVPFTADEELSAYCAGDQLLSDLNKQCLDAIAMHEQSVAEYGADDPMTEMAALMKDSAASALQTRLLEVKAQAEKARAAKLILEAAREADRLARARAREQQSIEDYRRMEFFSAMEKNKGQDDAFPLWIAIFVWLCHQSFLRSRAKKWQDQFNRLAA
jgi:hypothetical protein